MSWLDSLIYGYRYIKEAGSAVAERATLNFTNLTVVDNPGSDQTDVSMPASSDTAPGFVPIITAGNKALISNALGTVASWGEIANSHIAAAAAIALSKLADGGATYDGQIMVRDDTGSTWEGLGNSDYLQIGSTAAASGDLRLKAEWSARWVFGGTTYGMIRAVNDDLFIGGAYTTKPVTIDIDASSLVTITGGTLRVGTGAASTGDVRLEDGFSIRYDIIGTDYGALTEDAGTLYLGGLYPTRPADININATTSVDLAIGANTELHATAAEILVNNNFAVNASPASYQSMVGGVFIANVTTAPSGNPAAGGFLYAEAGALKWRGSSGTITTIAPA